MAPHIEATYGVIELLWVGCLYVARRIVVAANPSGYSLVTNDIPIVLGMAARGDRNHDIAAWFGVNQGRIKEAKDGRFGTVVAAPLEQLPPKGPPGIKGRRLRSSLTQVLEMLSATSGEATNKAVKILKDAAAEFDTNEI